ncbi:MAG: hypothetical protein K9G76_02600 [Bacteroidales bacterium]|nr:hypothetical protein [Bacteroidales bacterium]MCF8404190.1 hypothetical protein [Bacteroidales bacterium]
MNQKEEEQLIIKYFRESYSDFPKGKLTNSESPDFILKLSPKKSIGIELTRLDQNEGSLKENIEFALVRKKDKIKLYQRNVFNQLWLIIHADLIKDSKSYHIANKIANWEFSSNFDKVFLFDLFTGKIFKLI